MKWRIWLQDEQGRSNGTAIIKNKGPWFFDTKQAAIEEMSRRQATYGKEGWIYCIHDVADGDFQ